MVLTGGSPFGFGVTQAGELVITAETVKAGKTANGSKTAKTGEGTKTSKAGHGSKTWGEGAEAMCLLVFLELSLFLVLLLFLLNCVCLCHSVCLCDLLLFERQSATTFDSGRGGRGGGR